MSPYLSLLSTAWRYARHERPRFALAYGMFVCANVIEAAEPFLYGWFVDKVRDDPSGAVRAVLIFAGAVLLLRALTWCLHGPARILELSLALRLSGNFLMERFNQALRLPVKWHQDHHSGATINRVRKAYEALRDFLMEGFIHVQAMSKLALCLMAMCWFSPRLGLMAAALGALTIFVTTRFDRPIIRKRRQYNEAEHAVSATLFDTLSNITTVITLRLERSMEAGLLRRLASYFEPWRGFILLNEWKWFVASMFVALIYALLAVGYVMENWREDAPFPVGGLVTLLAFAQQFASVFYNFAAQYNRIVRLATDLEGAAVIEDAWRSEGGNANAGELPAGWRRIELRHVSFSHAGAGPDTLGDVTFALRRGKRIALVGESGGGKSTLLALLRGLYAPSPGFSLEADSRPLSFATLNGATTLLPQEPEIFENTILYNITLGLPFEEADVWRACDLAQFSTVARALPKGLHTDIREKGVNLSGGQKQRLALARGLLAARDCPIVLFDEPTSSVDPRTEALIYEAVFEACRDKVLVSALHRLHLLRDFDEIYVLRDGRIVGRGTLEELLAHCPEFRDMWRHQAEPAGAQGN